ncbi:xylose isomerase-like protein [Aspergillus pseudotamarii]|uniref:Xylose isomerase-like protein n=1 Tax=Aspergillus pseudotamarii TaxID=132259 RepID=A0A5N6T6T9_ASPPS|nr:xylose isomerase-like protein [Aspergillus pseudotamarii]KAE8142055.1 xylose isomerase-like protein [Aspergillus pseudotamarii]
MTTDISKIPLSYATCSIGASKSDTLPRKLDALHQAGFTGIELAFPDIVSYAQDLLGHEVAEDNYAELVTVAQDIRKQCEAKNLKVMMLQPFANFEGWPRGSKEREDAFARAKGWIEVMRAVGTDLLQVGSTDTPLDELSATQENIITDLRELCNLLATHNMRLAYENWCWSTHAPTWKDVWTLVHLVGRPNIGLCLDTFQTAGSEWGDPTTYTGRIEDLPVEELDRRLEKSLEELASTVPAEKIYLLQVSDAYKPVRPIEGKMIDGAWPRARWSHDYRPRPYGGGYLPIERVARAVLKTGFRGWFSMEIFDGGAEGKGKEYEMGEYAWSAMESMRRLLESSAE